MAQELVWLEDGTPFSPRFGDRYHSSANQGLDQARQVFFGGCGLPQAWAGAAQWRILETGFGLGLNFLVTWAAWLADPQRPQRLHFVSCEAWPVSAQALLDSAPDDPQLRPLAAQLAAQFEGLLPGVHRLAFEQGRVLLTLYIGNAQAMLRQQRPLVDSVYLDGFNPRQNPQMWDIHLLKAVGRCCQRGTRLATWCVAAQVRQGLEQCGFVVSRVAGVPPKRHNLQAHYNPRWQPRSNPPLLPAVALVTANSPGKTVVVGGGLAGAAVAASLAQRGWQVRVLDAAPRPAMGASGLPAGLWAPHVSPDDSVLSRLSRAGVRCTLQALRQYLPEREHQDWAATGVLEHGVSDPPRLPWPETEGAGAFWSRPASLAQWQAHALSGMDAAAPAACWHAQAGWLRPSALVQRLLEQPGISWQGEAAVAGLRCVSGPSGESGRRGGRWQLLSAQGSVLAQADLVVVCGGAGSPALLPSHWPLQAIRGQVSWGEHQAALAALPWPPQPVNGHGNLVPFVPAQQPGGLATWVLGATFERDCTALPPTAQEAAHGHRANLGRLQALLPTLGQQLTQSLSSSGEGTPPHAWAGVRCATPDRLPLVGPVDAQQSPRLWVCTAMGSRGLTLALLCAEVLAARLHDEPLPLEARLAYSLRSERMHGKKAGNSDNSGG